MVNPRFVDSGETLQKAVVREILEETDQKVKPIGIICIRSMVRESDKLTDLYCIFLCLLQLNPESFTKDKLEVREVIWMLISKLDNDSEVISYT